MKKIDQKMAQDVFESQGCKLLSEYTEYYGSLKYQCVCGEVASIKFSNFMRGSRCEKCRRKNASDKKRLSQKEVEKYFLEQNCELLDEYKNSSSIINYKCSCGNLSKTTLGRFKKGSRCDSCGRAKHSGEFHPKWISDRKEVDRRRKLRARYRDMLSRTFESLGRKKTVKSEVVLGYTCEDLNIHIKSHANWEEISKSNWHIDHIFPIKAFLEHGIEDVSLINCLDNLRPMPALDNWIKNDKYEVPVFRKWLNEKGWFLKNGVYSKLQLESIGKHCSFYVPIAKNELIKNRLHEYFIQHHNAYTVEIIGLNGFWRKDVNSNLIKENHIKYVCSIPDKYIEIFVDFLSKICSIINEEAIYLTMGNHSYLVYPKKGQNEV